MCMFRVQTGDCDEIKISQRVAHPITCKLSSPNFDLIFFFAFDNCCFLNFLFIMYFNLFIVTTATLKIKPPPTS